MIKLNRMKAMTLVEVIIALAILSIIVIAFLNMFLAGIMGIFRAGDKGVAYSMAQDDLDTRIASGESVETDALELYFNEVLYSVNGGLVESKMFVRNSSSKIDVFIPLVPTINISPKVNYEGVVNPVTINVVGTYTNFSGLTTAEIRNKFGVVIVGNPSVSVTNATNAKIVFSADLINSESDYILRMVTPISGEPDEVARAKYSVSMPNLVAVSENAMYVSYNGEYWMERSSHPTYPSLITLYDVGFGAGKYIAVGSNGRALVYKEQLGWDVKNISGAGAVNDVTWSSYSDKFYTASGNGRVNESDTGDTWTQRYTDPSARELYGISATATGKIVAVGEAGTIMYSSDGTTWSDRTITGEVDFNKVVAIDDGSIEFYIIVGDSGTIYQSVDAVTWNKRTLVTSSNINGVKQNLGRIVAVGDDGVILTSLDRGVTWTEMVYGAGTIELNDAAFLVGTNKVFVVGDGIILVSENLMTWSISETISGEVFTSISGK